MEEVECLGLQSLIHADSGIDDRHGFVCVRRRDVAVVGVNGNATCFGELHGVVHEIAQDLSEANRVSVNRVGQIWRQQ